MPDTVACSLEPAEWNIVGAGLGEMPYKVAAPIVAKLQQQLQAATAPAPVIAPVAAASTGDDTNA